MMNEIAWRLNCVILVLAVCLAIPACRPHENKEGDTDKADASLSADREVLEKLNRITVPRFCIQSTAHALALFEVAEFLNKVSRDYDASGNPSEQRGVRFALQFPRTVKESDPYMWRIPELDVPSGSLYDSLTNVCKAFGMEFAIKNRNIIVAPKGKSSLAMKPPTESSPADSQVISDMKRIIIPKCCFYPPADLTDVVDYFQQASRDYDWRNVPSEQRGVNFAIRLKGIARDYSPLSSNDSAGLFNETNTTTSLFVIPNLSSTSLYDLLVLICDASGATFIVHDRTVIVMEREERLNWPWQEETAAELAAEANIPKEHALKLCNNMEHFLTDPATFRIGYSTDPGADFRKQCEAYAQTNALPFTNVARLVQGKIVFEFDSFRSGPYQTNNFTSCQLDRCAAAIKLLRNFYDPVVFPFIYNMSIKKGQFQYIFIDMCNEVLAHRQPVSEMRRALNDPLLGKFIDLPALWEEVRQRMVSAIDTPNHVCTQTGERLDELMPFIIDYLPKIDDEWKLLLFENTLRPFWPEYRISLQRNMIWGKIENLESSVDLTGGKKKMEEDFKNAPRGGYRLDLRKKYNTLPPPATEKMPEKK